MNGHSESLAKKVRESSVIMVHKAKASHIGGALSIVDILAVLYNGILDVDPKNPSWSNRDRCLLSKGHSCVALYATLAHVGFFDVSKLNIYGQNGSLFLSHTTHHIPGIEISAGSLGHGLPIAAGIALGLKKKNKTCKSYVILGDGEMDEGSNWEALLFASQFKLSNLCVIIDYNKIQSFGNTNEVINLEPLADKIKAFNCNVITLDGHNHNELFDAFDMFKKQTNDMPSVIIANTIKGKGVSYMENNLLWHYRSPNEEQLEQALSEIRLK